MSEEPMFVDMTDEDLDKFSEGIAAAVNQLGLSFKEYEAALSIALSFHYYSSPGELAVTEADILKTAHTFLTFLHGEYEPESNVTEFKPEVVS